MVITEWFLLYSQRRFDISNRSTILKWW